jgi:hypothetical protein
MNIAVVSESPVLSLGRLLRRVLGAVGAAEAAFFEALDAFSGYEVIRRR